MAKNLPKKAKGGGAPPWMVTFGDMMSLLLTFFVLLFTYSTMDVEKYKALAGSIRNAFGFSLVDQLRGMVEVGGLATRDKTTTMLIPPAERKDAPGVPNSNGSAVPKSDAPAKPDTQAPVVKLELDKAGQELIEDTYKQVRDARAAGLAKDLRVAVNQTMQGARIDIERKDGTVLIRFPNEIAFPSGSSEITDIFTRTLKLLVPLLAATPGAIVVLGHTDNVPISVGAYRSNWELSVARATSVVHLLVADGSVPSSRITVQGFGDSRPLSDNGTDEGCAKNRRVEITIRVQD
jgi:chemotaxis protein MotB